jgi:hypothetical protein
VERELASGGGAEAGWVRSARDARRSASGTGSLRRRGALERGADDFEGGWR